MSVQSLVGLYFSICCYSHTVRDAERNETTVIACVVVQKSENKDITARKPLYISFHAVIKTWVVNWYTTSPVFINHYQVWLAQCLISTAYRNLCFRLVDINTHYTTFASNPPLLFILKVRGPYCKCILPKNKFLSSYHLSRYVQNINQFALFSNHIFLKIPLISIDNQTYMSKETKPTSKCIHYFYQFEVKFTYYLSGAFNCLTWSSSANSIYQIMPCAIVKSSRTCWKTNLQFGLLSHYNCITQQQ